MNGDLIVISVSGLLIEVRCQLKMDWNAGSRTANRVRAFKIQGSRFKVHNCSEFAHAHYDSAQCPWEWCAFLLSLGVDALEQALPRVWNCHEVTSLSRA